MEGRLRSTERPKRAQKRRNLYIAESDEAVWREAEIFASKNGVSLSSLVVESLAQYLRKVNVG